MTSLRNGATPKVQSLAVDDQRHVVDADYWHQHIRRYAVSIFKRMFGSREKYPANGAVSDSISKQTDEYVLVTIPERFGLGPPSELQAIERPLTKLILRGRAKKLLLDFSRTTFISSAALGMLEIVRRHSVARGVKVILISVPKNIWDVFRITRMSALFPACPSLEEALSLGNEMEGRFADSVSALPYRKGQVLGADLEILGVLNRGGMGVICLAQHRSTGKFRIVKTFRDEYLASPEAREAFLKEARLWTGLGKHPFIVAAGSAFEHEGRPYLEMEYILPDINGEVTLRDRLANARGGIPLRRILRWGIQFCLGMEHANKHGLQCHRDIKPENLLIARHQFESGETIVFSSHLRIVKVSDFGLARSVDSLAPNAGPGSRPSDLRTSFSLCVTQTCCGTPPYMAPEQFEGTGLADARLDIYAFGVVLYEMAAGHRPFEPAERSHDPIRAWHDAHRGDPRRLDTPLWPVICKCLAKDPAHRFQRMEELRSELEGLDKRCQEKWDWPYPF